MVTLFGILNIGSRGVSAAQAGLDTTGNNIANANTEGYSRQTVIQRSVDPITFTYGSLGQGTEVVTVERIRDMLLEGQLNDANSDKNFYEEMDQVLIRIQSILNDPLTSIGDDSEQASTGGINSVLSRFFEAFHELSNSPEAPEVRTAAIESAESLAQTLSVASQNFQTYRQDLNEQVSFHAEEINKKTQEIALLNQKISATEGGSRVSANEYRDRRDLLVNELSELIPIKVIENSNGSINVSIAGQTIVDTVAVTPLVIERVESETDMDINSIRIGEEGLEVVDDKLRSGKLGAILDARDRLVPYLQEQINEFARGVIYEVNKIHGEASGIEGYQSVTSHMDFPEGADDPESQITLERIFNKPLTVSEKDLENRPYDIQDGSFSIRVADGENETRDVYTVEVNTSDTLTDIVERIDRSDGIVNVARSSLRFDPVYIEKAQAQKGAVGAEINDPISSYESLAGTPIAETPGAYSFQIFVKNRAGQSVDADATTPEVEPFTIDIDSGMTMQEAANAIQTTGAGKIRAQLVPSDDDPNVTVLRIEGIEKGSTVSIQNDTSGMIEAFDFPITDPSIPLLGGNVSEATTSFSGNSSDSLLGSGSPSFNTVYAGPPPNVIGEGDFELVVVNNINQLAAKETISISSTGIDTLDELAAAIEAANSHLDVEITPDNQFIVTASDNYSFFFQNDTTGLIESMGFSEISGYGKIADEPFQQGSFEIVVANETGKVTHIVEVPVSADPSWNGGLYSMNDIVDQINRSSDLFGAPLFASIVPDPSDPTKNQLQIESETGYEFTFRSDDSLLLSALGFHDGPVLDETGDNPILGASGTVGIGDSIGGMVRARLTDNGEIEISTTDDDQLTFVDDTSYFLAATQINALFTGTNASNMSVNEDILENSNLLAASSDGTVGNNAAALAVAVLQDEIVLNNMTLNEFYRSTISTLGNEGSRNMQFLQTSEDILQELETLRDQNSGVSLDEESINLIRFQQAFQASARFINTIDQLMDVVINQIGA